MIGGTISSLCFALIGFVRPYEVYVRYVRAWRLLEASALRYQYEGESLTDLLKTKEAGEHIIAASEAEAAKDIG